MTLCRCHVTPASTSGYASIPTPTRTWRSRTTTLPTALPTSASWFSSTTWGPSPRSALSQVPSTLANSPTRPPGGGPSTLSSTSTLLRQLLSSSSTWETTLTFSPRAKPILPCAPTAAPCCVPQTRARPLRLRAHPGASVHAQAARADGTERVCRARAGPYWQCHAGARARCRAPVRPRLRHTRYHVRCRRA